MKEKLEVSFWILDNELIMNILQGEKDRKCFLRIMYLALDGQT